MPSPRIPISLKELVEDLLNVTPGGTPDYDGDGLPDPVEAIIGTDFNDTDLTMIESAITMKHSTTLTH